MSFETYQVKDLPEGAQQVITERVNLINAQDEIGGASISYVSVWEDGKPESVQLVHISSAIKNITKYSREEIEKIGLNSIVAAILSPEGRPISIPDMRHQRAVEEQEQKERKRDPESKSYQATYLITEKDGNQRYVDDVAEKMEVDGWQISFGYLHDVNTKMELVRTLGESVDFLKEEIKKDRFTGLADKANTVSILGEGVSNALEREEDYSMAIIDLDYFKTVNDTLGHAVGDKVIIGFAVILREVVRGDGEGGEFKKIGIKEERDSSENDVACRIGGDEFAILMPGADAEVAKKHVLNRLRDRFDKEKEKGIDGVFGVSKEDLGLFDFSAAVSDIKEAEIKNGIDLYVSADKKMYEVKKNKKGSR